MPSAAPALSFPDSFPLLALNTEREKVTALHGLFIPSTLLCGSLLHPFLCWLVAGCGSGTQGPIETGVHLAFASHENL